MAPNIDTLQDSGVSGVTAYTLTDLLLHYAGGMAAHPIFLSIVAALIPFIVQWLREWKKYYWDVKRNQAGIDRDGKPITKNENEKI